MIAHLLFTVFLVSHVYARDVDFCFADEDDPYLYMATKTAYHFVHAGKTRFQDVPSKYIINNIVSPSYSKKFLFAKYRINFIDCRAEQVWMLATHGTQCPSQAEIIQMLTLTELQTQIINNHESRNGKRKK